MAAVLVTLLPRQSQAGVLEAGEESELCREGKKEWNAQLSLGGSQLLLMTLSKFLSVLKQSRAGNLLLL